ncbi:MAG: type I glyceraldehyde-3-phosphate dehydrogenase [Elusimicrobiaceae bacterium]|nr:type I glyceraldehyde-3-phosphate dehydrogenase [Elusimicrobiaceae bacterium]
MAVKVGINGFGRIGRLVLKSGINNPDIEFVAVNDLTDARTLAHLFKYDSTFGIFPGEVKAEGDSLVINGRKIKVVSEKNPESLPWKALGVELVYESTGRFCNTEKAAAHLAAGAKKVIITAPAKGDGLLTVCMGINEGDYAPGKHNIISNASCTTNCLAPVAKVLNDNLTIKTGLMTTIHSYTNDQVILDAPHKDLRRARAAGQSMIPTTTGAAAAIGLVIPSLKGKLDGIAIRVPTPNVSLVDIALTVEKATTVAEVNAMMKKAADGALNKYLEYTEEPLVSKDFNGNAHSSIFDASLTHVVDGTHVKVYSWYDNEWGYSNRVNDLACYIAKKGF